MVCSLLQGNQGKSTPYQSEILVAVETRIKEPTFLGESRLKALVAFTIHILGIGEV